MALRTATILIGLFGLATPAYALDDQPNAQQAVAEVQKPTEPEDKIICRSKREANTGSNMRGSRDCRKASEWKEREVAAKRELQRLQDKQQTHGQNLGR